MDEWKESAPGILFLSLSLHSYGYGRLTEREWENTKGIFFASALRLIMED